MPFRNPTTSLPASSLEGQITGDQIAADAIDGKTITGALIRTAATGRRVELTPDGRIVFHTGQASQTATGEIVTGVASSLPGWYQGYLRLRPPAHGGYTAPTLDMYVDLDGTQVWKAGPIEGRIVPEGTARFPFVYLNGTTHVDGVFTRANSITGRVDITPSAPDTPTPLTITGLGLAAGEPRAFVAAISTVPGTSMKGVSVSNVTTNSLTIWLTRANTATTSVYYHVITGEG